MSCPKCQGLEVVATYHDHESAFVMARCVNCGRVSDPVMERNRSAPAPKPWIDVSAGSRRPRHTRTGRGSAYDERHALRT